jgi:hypothetical protein
MVSALAVLNRYLQLSRSPEHPDAATTSSCHSFWTVKPMWTTSTVQAQPSMRYVPRPSTRTTLLKLTSRPPCVWNAAAIASATRCPDACIDEDSGQFYSARDVAMDRGASSMPRSTAAPHKGPSNPGSSKPCLISHDGHAGRARAADGAPVRARRLGGRLHLPVHAEQTRWDADMAQCRCCNAAAAAGLAPYSAWRACHWRVL